MSTEEDSDEIEEFPDFHRGICVVAAPTEHEAKLIHPSEHTDRWDLHRSQWVCECLDGEIIEMGDHNWSRPDQVTATKIGIAIGDVKAGDVLCASYNAG